MLLALSQSCGFAVAGAGPLLYRFPPSMSTWSDSAWQWGSATGEAHRAAAQLRRSLGTAEARAAFLASVCSGEADWSTCELALALKCQHAAKRCYGKATDALATQSRQHSQTLPAPPPGARPGHRGAKRLARAHRRSEPSQNLHGTLRAPSTPLLTLPGAPRRCRRPRALPLRGRGRRGAAGRRDQRAPRPRHYGSSRNARRGSGTIKRLLRGALAECVEDLRRASPLGVPHL